MRLAQLQSAFQAALLDGSSGVLEHLGPNAREPKDVMFGVYRNAYVFRLADILADDFERLHTYIGDEAFFSLARAYIAAHPSQSANARDFGRGFPKFVSEQDIAIAAPMVSAVALLEGVLNDVFDCADAPALTLEDLSVYAPEDFERLVFKPPPSAWRLDGPGGLDATFTALGNGQPPPAPPDGQTTDRMIVWRKDVLPHYRALSYEEAMIWSEAAKGAPFGTLCELLATYASPETAAVRAAGYLHGWIGNGQLASVELSS